MNRKGYLLVMGNERNDSFKDESYFWLEQRSGWWSSSLKVVACEEQGFWET